jgi:hypothetical protein
VDNIFIIYFGEAGTLRADRECEAFVASLDVNTLKHY